MKKLILGLSFCMALSFYACGGGDSDGGGKAMDASKVDFSNPTGTLSEDNADEVGTKAVKLQNGFSSPYSVLSNVNQLEIFTKAQGNFNSDCVDANSDGTTVTFDLGCLDTDTSGCSLKGKVTVTTNGTLSTTKWKNVKSECSGTEEGFSINGEQSYDSATGNSCWDLVSSNGSDSRTVEGCYNNNGQALVSVDGKTFVLSGVLGDCTDVTLNITDTAGDSVLECTVTAPTSCSSVVEVTDVENCTIN